MAGHSKWANIKHKKKAKDQKKSKLFSKLTNDIKTSLKEKTISGENNKLKNAINKALNNNLNKSIINKIIEKNDKTYKTNLFSFKKNEYILIVETIIDKKNKNISEIKNTLISYNFKHITNEEAFPFFEKECKININNEYNEKNILNSSYNLKIKDFKDDNIYIEYDLLKELTNINKKYTLNAKIDLNFFSKIKIKIKNIDEEDIKTLIKKIKKKDFIINTFANIKNNF